MLLPILDRPFFSMFILSVLIRAAACVVSTQMNMLGICVLRHFLLQISFVPLTVSAILLLVCSFVMFATSIVGECGDFCFLFSLSPYKFPEGRIRVGLLGLSCN